MTDAQLTSFEQTTSSILKPVLAFAGASNPVTAISAFGLGMVFRVLKLRAKITKAKEGAAAGLAAKFGATGLLRIPVIVADPIAQLRATFVRNLNFTRNFPEVARQFKREIDELRARGTPGDAVRRLQVVKRIVLPVFVDDLVARKFSDPELQSLFGDLIAMDPPDLQRVVSEFIALDRDRNASRSDDAINEELIRLQVGLARERIESMQASDEAELAKKIRELVESELLGTSGAIAATAKFVGERQVERIAADIAREEAELAALNSVTNPNDEQNSRIAVLAASMKSRKANKVAMENSIKP